MEDIKYLNENYYKNVDWLFERTAFQGETQKTLVGQLLMRYVEHHEKPGDMVKLHIDSAMCGLLRARDCYVDFGRHNYMDAEYRAHGCAEFINRDIINVNIFDRGSWFSEKFFKVMFVEKGFEHLRNFVLGLRDLKYKHNNICVRYFSEIGLDEQGRYIEFVLSKHPLCHLITNENLPYNDDLGMKS